MGDAIERVTLCATEFKTLHTVGKLRATTMGVNTKTQQFQKKTQEFQKKDASGKMPSKPFPVIGHVTNHEDF